MAVPQRRKLKKRSHTEDSKRKETNCEHPAIVGGLCAVCGEKVGQDNDDDNTTMKKNPKN